MNTKDYWELFNRMVALEEKVAVLESEIARKADKPGRKPNIPQESK